MSCRFMLHAALSSVIPECGVYSVKPKNHHSKSCFTDLGNRAGQVLYYVYCAAEDDELLDGCWQRNSTDSPSCGNNEALSSQT